MIGEIDYEIYYIKEYVIFKAELNKIYNIITKHLLQIIIIN